MRPKPVASGGVKDDDGGGEASADSEGSLKTVEEILKTLTDDESFEKYALDQFKLDRKGMFNSKTSVEKITSWKNDLIKTSLLKVSERC